MLKKYYLKTIDVLLVVISPLGVFFHSVTTRLNNKLYPWPRSADYLMSSRNLRRIAEAGFGVSSVLFFIAAAVFLFDMFKSQRVLKVSTLIKCYFINVVCVTVAAFPFSWSDDEIWRGDYLLPLRISFIKISILLIAIIVLGVVNTKRKEHVGNR